MRLFISGVALLTDLISKLSPQSCQPMKLSGKPGINASDISHACRAVDGIGYYLVLIKYSGDFSCYDLLRTSLFDRISEEAQRGHWKKRRIPQLIRLSVSEYTGTKQFRDCERAEAIGVHPSVWLRIWKKKYERLMEVMQAYEECEIYSIGKQLR